MRDFRFPEHVLGLVVVLCGRTLNLCWRVGTPLCKEQHPEIFHTIFHRPEIFHKCNGDHSEQLCTEMTLGVTLPAKGL